MRGWRFFCLLLFFFSVVAIGKVRESAALKLNRGRKRNDREGRGGGGGGRGEVSEKISNPQPLEIFKTPLPVFVKG